MAQITLNDNIKSVAYNAHDLDIVKCDSSIVWRKNIDKSKCIIFSTTADATLTVTQNDSSVEYSTDGVTWSAINGSARFSLNPTKVYLRNQSTNIPSVKIEDGPVDIKGNITTMLDYTKPYKEVDIPEDAFNRWLYQANVRSVPSIICRTAGAYSLAFYAYESSVSVTPVIDIDTACDFAITQAFDSCSSLSGSVSVKAGTCTGTQPLREIFGGTSFTEGTLTIDDVSDSYLALCAIFAGCSKLTKAWINVDLVGGYSMCQHLFNGCSSLRDIYFTSSYLGTDLISAMVLPEIRTEDLGTIHCTADAEVGTLTKGWTVVRDVVI